MKGLNEEKSQRLMDSKIIWLSTISADQTPHLVPIWFIVNRELIFCCTGKKSVKARNIEFNNNIAFSLEDGTSPIIGKGKARIIDPPYHRGIIDLFIDKYDWNIANDSTYDCLVEITPTKWIMS